MKKKVLFSKLSWLQTPQNGQFEKNKTKQRVSFSNNQKKYLDTRVFMVFFKTLPVLIRTILTFSVYVPKKLNPNDQKSSFC